jgi:hypothetical protein
VQLKQLALKGLLIQRHCFNTLEFSDGDGMVWLCATGMMLLQPLAT